MPRDKLSDQMAYPPRGMRAERAAAYLGISSALFHRLVAEAVIPQPVRLHGAVLWDRYALDAVLDRLQDSEPENTIHKLLKQRAQHHDQTTAQHKATVRKVREGVRVLPLAERKTDPAAD